MSRPSRPSSSSSASAHGAIVSVFRVLSVAFPLVLCVTLLACNVVHLQHQGFRRDFARAGLREHTVALGPDRIHYWRSDAPPEGGGKTPVLLLHGFGGSAVWQWAEQLPALVPTRAVVVPDLLWFGGSDSDNDDPSLDHQVAALIALLDHEDLARVHVVGISYGGLVGSQLTLHHPERVAQLVLVDSPGPDYESEDEAALLARFGVDNVAELIIPSDEAGVRRLIEVAYYAPPSTPRFALRQVKREMYDPYRARQAALLHDLVDNRARYANDKPLGAPLGLIWGAQDTVFPLAIGQRLSAERSAPLHVIDNARHAPNLEHPERFNEALLALLDGSP